MKNILLVAISIVTMISCTDDSDCQTCVTSTTGGDIVKEFCQEGTDVIESTNGVLSTISNTTVEAVVITQENTGAICN